VLAPLGRRTLRGFIVGLGDKLERDIALKNIAGVLDEQPFFSPSFLKFSRRLSDWFYSSWGELLESSLPPSFQIKSRIKILLSDPGKKALGDGSLPKAEKALAELLRDKSYSATYLKRKLNVKNLSMLLSRMERKGLLLILSEEKKTSQKAHREKRSRRPAAQLELDFSLDQKLGNVATAIGDKIREKRFAPFLLHGSAERRLAIYFSAIRKALAQSEKALFLVPEINLTQNLVDEFEKKLGESVSVLHSRLSERAREREWHRIRDGEASVVVGPRSALFTAISGLRLLIVDEEQDDSYLQLESPSYDARRGAWLRAEEVQATLIYGSATPSVEGFYKAQNGKWLVSLGEEPRKSEVRVVDQRGAKGIISSAFQEAIERRLGAQEQVVIFFNRRGYAAYLVCSRCRHVPRCPHCDLPLAYHKQEERLTCHRCRFSSPLKERCPECGGRMSGRKGLGVEAVAEELQRMFPQSRVACLDKDRTPTRREQRKIIQSFSTRKLDILVGTELLAHQSDLPPLFFLGIINPETMLGYPDFRAGFATFETLCRVLRLMTDSPRSEAIIQTGAPHHFSIRCAASHDYPCFFEREIELRRMMNDPPFSQIVEILFAGENLRTVGRRARAFFNELKARAGDIEVLGPALAPLSRLRGPAGVQIILRSSRKERLDAVLKELLRDRKLRNIITVFN
jgi:primosomal protein N' (replication factor Y)